MGMSNNHFMGGLHKSIIVLVYFIWDMVFNMVPMGQTYIKLHMILGFGSTGGFTLPGFRHHVHFSGNDEGFDIAHVTES